MRVFVDANILFSAAKSDGAVRRLLRLLVENGHECCADAYVVAEARRNLAVKGPEALAAFEALLRRLRVAGTASSRSVHSKNAAWLPEKDRPVLAAAIGLRCQALVTGDKTHFGPAYGQTFDGVTIRSPRSMLDALERPLRR